MHATESLEEADRLMTVCNSCRYCEGLCAVFPAMELRRAFNDGDLNYLANLCHSCGACFIDCQFAPPHEFNVNVPRNLAEVRAESYSSYVWPSAFKGAFRKNTQTIASALIVCILAFVLLFMIRDGAPALVTPRQGAGAFYALVPHAVLATLFSLAFILPLLAIASSLRNFWRDIGARERGAPLLGPLLDATRDAASLRYLDGGGAGCWSSEERTDKRRLYHHLTFYGFLLCFASTCVATVYHYAGREAPYGLMEPPVVLGLLGGVGMTIGTIGLLFSKRTRHPEVVDRINRGMDNVFTTTLLLVAVTGLALLAVRDTVLMPSLLAVHLGCVLAFFLTMPYGKFVHGFYRFFALIRYAYERRQLLQHGAGPEP